jgi:hypothetical protein
MLNVNVTTTSIKRDQFHHPAFEPLAAACSIGKSTGNSLIHSTTSDLYCGKF